MAIYPYHVILLLLAFIISTFCFGESLNGGFSVELIHRDSSKSPFYNPTETPFQRLTNAFHRSMNRIQRFYPNSKVSPNAPEADIVSNQGEYLMMYSIGTPPVKILGIADTGSDLIWSQCKPCEACYNQTKPLFDPSKSTTYKTIPCTARLCESLGQTSCGGGESSICEYSVSYGDGSYSTGDLAFETLTLGSTTGHSVSFPKIPIGCGHSNDGTFNSNGSGIVGLGGGSVSLISNIGPSIDFKFSYCLVPFFDSQTDGKLNFGQNALVKGSGTVSTPLVQGPVDTFYYLTLEGISVGEKRLDFMKYSSASTSSVDEGNIIIDSGTTLTFLPEEFYDELESEVAAQIKLKRVKNEMLNLCYSAAPNTINAPVITAHFSGADIELLTVNTFVSVSEDVTCFAFASAQSNGAIFGNLAQANFLVGYDLEKKVLSFKPTDCSKM